MELLFSLRFVLVRSSLDDAAPKLKTVESIIKKVQKFLWAKCTNGAFASGDRTVIGLYESFYRKLVLRDRSLPRPWVFTTNYDSSTRPRWIGSACHTRMVFPALSSGASTQRRFGTPSLNSSM
jgi:hypothetical protein